MELGVGGGNGGRCNHVSLHSCDSQKDELCVCVHLKTGVGQSGDLMGEGNCRKTDGPRLILRSHMVEEN